MSATQYNRMALLQSLDELTAHISKNRFVSTRPNAVGQQMQDFLLIRLPQPITDPADTYQLTTGQINVFARDGQGGLENTRRLEQMQQAVISLFPIRTDNYIAYRPILLNGGADGAGFHSLIIQFNIRIHKDFDIHPKGNLKL